jgi:hypothetical protein
LRLLRRMMEVPPKDWVHKAKIKLGMKRSDLPDITDILADPKNVRFQRPYDFLSRYEAIIARHHEWEPIRFENSRVIELGSGPVLGWGPLAVFLGCESYTCVDPFFNPNILDDPVFVNRYLLGLYKDLSALYGSRINFEDYVSSLKSRIIVKRSHFLESDVEGPFDVVLSNSCLEHVFPLKETIIHLRSVTTENCRFLHLVDFGNHISKEKPFSDIYRIRPEEFLEKNGQSINLLRGPDMLRIFQEAGFQAALIPYYSQPEGHDETFDSYWTGLYSEETLFLKAGLIAGSIAQ